MPLIDMPLSELKTYKGRNPKPEDFDKYWDESLAEMNTVDPKVSLIPSAFKSPVADCYDMLFTGVHGAKIHAKLKP